MAALPGRSTDPADMAMRVASAVLGDLRAEEMRDRIIERVGQARRVGQAAAFLAGQPPSRRAQCSPTLASAEAARMCRERIEALDADLRAIAWHAAGTRQRRTPRPPAPRWTVSPSASRTSSTSPACRPAAARP